MVIEPKIRGFICTAAHPVGCAKNVEDQIAYVKEQGALQGPKKVLVLGSSTGYGLASRIVAAFGARAKTIGVCFERAAAGKRTATAGWYNTAAFEEAAQKAGIYAKTVNGDAFSDEIKQQTIDLIKQDWGGAVDLVVYSLASPRRKHPKTGEIFNSVLKPIGETFVNKTVDVMSGEVSEVRIEPATPDEIFHTVMVMGGEDWAMWIEALLAAGVLAKGAKTVAYSYIGPELTHAVYRNGTIGKAKEHLEKAARELDHLLMQQCQGHAYVSVNKGLVTQSSAAIPVVPLYISLLYQVMKEKGTHEGCIEQMWRLFAERLYRSDGQVPLDEKKLIRIDELEMDSQVQSEIEKRWQQVNTQNLSQLADIEGYRREFHQLFGFKYNGVDYQADVEAEVRIPSVPVQQDVSA